MVRIWEAHRTMQASKAAHSDALGLCERRVSSDLSPLTSQRAQTTKSISQPAILSITLCTSALGCR
eukprot:2137221-Pyramimonas_sp.AAC.1